MSRKAAAGRAPKAPVTREAVSRTMSAVAAKHGGQIPAGSYVGRLQRSEAGASGGKKGAAVSGTGRSSSQRQHDDDNRANQLNPNNDAYWQSRGEKEHPGDWEQRQPDQQE